MNSLTSERIRHHSRWLVLLFALLGMGCESEVGLLCEISEPLAPVIRVSPDEVAGADRWEAVEVWRASGIEDGGAQLMMPTSARVGAAGILAIADFLSGDVWLIDREGAWLNPVAGRGQGPGELLNPLATAWTPRGELLALDASQSKLERYDLESRTSETLSLPSDLLGPVFSAGEVGWFGLRGDGVAFVELPLSASEPRTVSFARAGPGDEERLVVWRTEYPNGLVPAYDQPTPAEWPRSLLGVGSEGWVVAPRSDEYELIIYGSNDEPALHLCVSDRERFRQEGPDRYPPPPQVAEQIEALPSPEREAVISRIYVDFDGRIWIERELPRVGSPFDLVYGVAGAHLDVLTSRGEFLARMRLPEDLRFQDAKGDTIWAFSIGEFDEVDLVASEIRSAE